MNYLPELFEFLLALKANNHKTWFDENKPTYQQLRTAFTATVKDFHAQLVGIDAALATVEPAKCLFRINRDIRFSKDKSPYKTNFSSYMAAGGSQSELAGYYLHIEPNNCFMGGGLYMPANPELKKVRQEIDYNAQDFLAIVQNPDFVRCFGKVQGEKLKNTPTDYAKDHPLAEYLKLKGFFVVHHLPIEKLTTPDAIHYLISVCKIMYPLNEFLNKAVK